MSRIQLLPEEVASQVAAGEVVERPAAVVKELVENSLDAHASRIEVQTRRGGISLIQVTDNGIGMDRDDALLCLERHATSKIRSGNDLANIHTLGFRGEALPSIASVSRFRLSTREHGALVGTEILVSGGRMESVRDGGDAPGTQIEVRSLFFNLPARRKFLRTEATEAGHVEQQMHLLALGHPSVSFAHIQDDKLLYQLPPAVRFIDRIRDLCGSKLAAELLEIPPFQKEEVHVSGYIGRAGLSRSTRQQQLCFLNGRAVENITVSQALREGYHTALMKGQYPVTFLLLSVDPAAVDVNVHPAKREVRFRDPARVRQAVVEAIQRTLQSDRTLWSQQFASPASKGGSPETDSSTRYYPSGIAENPITTGPLPEQAQFLPPFAPPKIRIPAPAQSDSRPHVPGSPVPPSARITANAPESEPARKAEMPAADSKTSPVPAPESFRFLGVLGKLYVLIENASGLVLVDQHAAHERILFEQMLHRMETQGVPSQKLLIPLTLTAGPPDAAWLNKNRALLDKAGIELESFGPGSFKIDALPTFLKAADPIQLLHDIIDDLKEATTQSARFRLGEDMIAKTVCRHAVKANDSLKEPELQKLVEDLLSCDLPYCCPHGRPTMIQISYAELEKKFGRKA